MRIDDRESKQVARRLRSVTFRQPLHFLEVPFERRGYGVPDKACRTNSNACNKRHRLAAAFVGHP